MPDQKGGRKKTEKETQNPAHKARELRGERPEGISSWVKVEAGVWVSRTGAWVGWARGQRKVKSGVGYRRWGTERPVRVGMMSIEGWGSYYSDRREREM